MKTALVLLGVCGCLTSAFALPAFEPFANATASGGTAYTNGAPLFDQTNAFGEGWSQWNGGASTSFVYCTNAGLSYGNFPAAFPAASSTNAAYLPGQADFSGGVSGLSAALNFSKIISADPNNLATNKIFASFLIRVSNLGYLDSASPIYFAGFATNTGGQIVALPASAGKIFLKGNSATAGSSTKWSIGVANNSGFTSAAFDSGGHTSNDVLFVVVDYEFGVNDNPDVMRLWVNPAPASFGAAAPPAATASTNITSAANEIAQAADFFLLDRTGGTIWGRLFMSNLRLGTTWSYVTGGPEITNEPQSVISVPGGAAAFNVGAVSGSVNNPLSYQWWFNGTNLPNNVSGAATPALAISNLAPADAGNYTVVVSNALGTALSSVANLSFASTNAPALLGAQSLGLNDVLVSLSQPLALPGATNLANYLITGTNGDLLTISNAMLDASQSNVLLTVGTMLEGETYTLTVSNLANVFYPISVIAPGSQTNFVAVSYVSAGIGNPPNGGGQVLLTNGISVAGIGTDIGGAGDQFQFSYKVLTGDFDLSVNLQNLNLSDVWAKAGLMARASLNSGSPFAASLGTPSMAGDFAEFRSVTNGTATLAGRSPANFPNTWLRLARSGNTFTSYASFDGQTWTQLGSATISMPNLIYFGLAVSSHNPDELAAAQFSLPESTPPGSTVGAISSPYEPPGPCSRKTGIVIYEINYKPAARADGRNLESIELYNTQPFFHDISGYTLTCADMNYTFPSNTIMQAGQFLVLAASPPDVQSVYGLTNVMGPYSGSLKKSETLELLDEQGNVLLTVPYSATYPWPVAADGTGHSIFLANPSYGEGDPRAWAISDQMDSPPGAPETYHPSPLRDVVINEILAHSETNTVPQFIELYNHSNQTNDLSGCILTDDASTNEFIVPPGTAVPPRGFISFDQSQLGFTLNGSGGTVYFINPDRSRILDAVQYEAQADGVSFGRWPDGANDFYFLQQRTPGAANSPILIGGIVINELMYKPISGNDDDQYIELYNQGTNSVNLSGWQFTAGVTFTIPTNTTLAPNGYLVVAEDLTNLFAKYPNLNSGNTVGNYSGHLSHNGERVALAQPETLNGTNTIYVVEDEVTYGIGGRWGEWADGGGSSLELIDPHSNHRLASNWADSDETQKSAWTNIECTGVLDNGSNYENGILHAQIGLLDVGECLVDDIEVDDSNGVNYVSNPDFESGLTGWSLQGCMVRSSLDSSGYNGGPSLHIRCSDRFWTGINSCQVALNANTLAPGQTANLSFEARWLHGWPEPILRVNGNWLEATGPMPIPSNLGSPGLPNSAYITNAGPAIYSVTHSPALPAANQNVVVTTRVDDPDGVQNLTLNYRIDPSSSYTSVPMTDDGTNGSSGDAIAGDGIFSATIPGQSSNTIVAFYISASDNLGAATRFPALLNDNSPVRECLVRFGDANPPESFGAYHFWCSATNVTRWSTLGDLSNEGIDCTFVNNSRVIYDAQAHYGGSPYHQSFNSPTGNLCHYDVDFPADDMLLGTTSFNRLHQPGNAPGSDASIQREQTSYTFMRALGEPWLYRRDVAVYVNGNRRGTLMEDSQIPDGDMINEYFPNGGNGFLYKMQPWFEFAPALSGYTLGKSNMSWCYTTTYPTTGGVKKTARYRYMFEMRRTPDSASNYTNVFALVDAASAYGTSNYVAGMENVCDLENWMRVFAVNHAVANSDSFGANTEQNLYGYASPADGVKYTLMMWDMNICLDKGTWSPGQNLFFVNSQDLNMTNIYLCPEFRRMYWRALEGLVNGPLELSNTAPLCDAKYDAFVADGLTGVEDPNASMLPWISEAQTSIAAQLAAVDATNFSVNPAMLVTNNFVYLSGVAPVNVKTISINGLLYTVTWTSVTNWTLAVPLQSPTNILSITGVDLHGQFITGDSNVVAVIDNAIQPPPPLDYIPYTSVGSAYTQDFDALPDPGATSVDANNPVMINSLTYSLTNPFCFADPVIASGGFGGLGITNLAGWYGLAGKSSKFGATDGDQTTGGDISFGLANNSNRALGLLATSSTTYTAFGVKFINQTPDTLNYLNLMFTGEVWRQSNVPKTLQFFYFIDPAATNSFSIAATASLPALNVSIPTVASDTNGVAVDGTASNNQTNLAVLNQVITNWPPGAALWLVWEMPDSTGKAQGLAIDNLTFSALNQNLSTLSALSAQSVLGGTNFVLSWLAPAGLQYQIQFTTNLVSPHWQPLGASLAGDGSALALTNAPMPSQVYYRLQILP